MDEKEISLRYWYLTAWQLYKGNVKKVVAATLIVVTHNWLMRLWLLLPHGLVIGRIYDLIIPPCLVIGFTFFCLKLIRSEQAMFRDLFAGFVRFIQVLAALFILYIVVIAGLLLFVVPGVIWALRFGFATIAVVDRKLSPLSSLRFSSRITKGHKAKLFVVGLVGGLFACLQLPFVYAMKDPPAVLLTPVMGVFTILYALSVIVIIPVNGLVFAVAYDKLAKYGSIPCEDDS